jgi:hypothetical protein
MATDDQVHIILHVWAWAKKTAVPNSTASRFVLRSRHGSNNFRARAQRTPTRGRTSGAKLRFGRVQRLRRLHRCRDTQGSHYCEDVMDSRELRHSKRVSESTRGSHLLECSRCRDSAYLVHCRDCADCTYCFGCVGLRGKDFHILNERYDRDTYFQTIVQLAAELRLTLP